MQLNKNVQLATWNDPYQFDILHVHGLLVRYFRFHPRNKPLLGGDQPCRFMYVLHSLREFYSVNAISIATVYTQMAGVSYSVLEMRRRKLVSFFFLSERDTENCREKKTHKQGDLRTILARQSSFSKRANTLFTTWRKVYVCRWVLRVDQR